MGRYIAAIGVIGEGNVTFLVPPRNHIKRGAIVEPGKPSGPKIERNCKGFPLGREQANCEVLRLLHKG